jgi:site-specific DNA recombinase
MERLLTGYQENLITLEELRCRMPDLRKQQRANEAELQSLEMTAVDPTRNLRLVETLAQFRTRLRQGKCPGSRRASESRTIAGMRSS